HVAVPTVGGNEHARIRSGNGSAFQNDHTTRTTRECFDLRPVRVPSELPLKDDVPGNDRNEYGGHGGPPRRVQNCLQAPGTWPSRPRGGLDRSPSRRRWRGPRGRQRQHAHPAAILPRTSPPLLAPHEMGIDAGPPPFIERAERVDREIVDRVVLVVSHDCRPPSTSPPKPTRAARVIDPTPPVCGSSPCLEVHSAHERFRSGSSRCSKPARWPLAAPSAGPGAHASRHVGVRTPRPCPSRQ